MLRGGMECHGVGWEGVPWSGVGGIARGYQEVGGSATKCQGPGDLISLGEFWGLEHVLNLYISGDYPPFVSLELQQFYLTV